MLKKKKVLLAHVNANKCWNLLKNMHVQNKLYSTCDRKFVITKSLICVA